MEQGERECTPDACDSWCESPSCQLYSSFSAVTHLVLTDLLPHTSWPGFQVFHIPMCLFKRVGLLTQRKSQTDLSACTSKRTYFPKDLPEYFCFLLVSDYLQEKLLLFLFNRLYSLKLSMCQNQENLILLHLIITSFIYLRNGYYNIHFSNNSKKKIIFFYKTWNTFLIAESPRAFLPFVI